MLGFGASAFGSSPLGSGEIEPAFDPTATRGGSRYIGVSTRDYEVDSLSGCYKQMPTTRQRVLIALATVRGSSTVIPELGLERAIKVDENFEAQQQAAVRDALRHMVEDGGDGSILIQSITVTRGLFGRSKTVVEYFDLVAGDGETQAVEVP